MNVVIIEDEMPAVNRLTRMLHAISGDINVIKKLDSVEASVNYFRSPVSVDLVFMDIQLADGLSFDIFQQAELGAPVIFTTAFDQYALKAFKVNSVDYLMKPVNEKELEQAVAKYRSLFDKKENSNSEKIMKMLQQPVLRRDC